MKNCILPASTTSRALPPSIYTALPGRSSPEDTCHSPFVPPPALLYKKHCIGWKQSQLSQKTVSRGKLLSFLINAISVTLKTSSKNESKLLSPLFISSCVILIQRIDYIQATYKASSSNCSKILKLMEISFTVCHMPLIPHLIFKAIVNACLSL